MAESADGGPPPISDGTPAPSSLEEFETLINRLYQPDNIVLVSSIEKHLQWHQRSAQGWEMAFALLQSSTVNVRFFGALTLAVKLNTSGMYLNEEETAALVQRLVELYVQRHEDVHMVAQKISSALALSYMLPQASADGCIRNIAASLSSHHVDRTSNGTHLHDQPIQKLLQHTSSTGLYALLKFVNVLAEEGSKRVTDAGADRRLAAMYQDRVQINISDAVEVMQFCYEPANAQSDLRRVRTASCFSTWALFCQRAAGIEPDQLTKLRTLIKPLLVLASGEYEGVWLDLQDPLDTAADLLSSYPGLFKTEHLQYVSEVLRSPRGYQYVSDLKEGDDSAMPFARLLCAYVDANLAYMVESFDDPAMAQIMGMMHELLYCNGFAAVDDDVVVEMSGVWNTYVEYIVDTSYDTGANPVAPWHEAAKAQIVRMVEEFWAKVQYPPVEEYREWSEDDKKAFQQFRTDVRDLLNTCHLALGTKLLQAFVEMSLNALPQQQWTQLEAALYCLTGIAESLDESDEEEAITAQLMDSGLYPALSRTDASIPLHVRRTAMRLIGNLGSYFERRPDSLPNALQYLFSSLAATTLAEPASRSIHSLCTACRESLRPQLEDFISLYEHYFNSTTASTFTKSNLIGSVAAVAQTQVADATKAYALKRLLTYVEADVRASIEDMAAANIEQSLTTGVSAMKSLSAIAKSFQETIEVVDLDGSPQKHSYWTDDADGQAVQQRIVRLITTTLEILGHDIEILEAVCETLKAGFTESSPGPFVLRPSEVISILLRPPADSQHVCLVLGTTCSFLRAYTPTTTYSIETEARALLDHSIDLIQQLGEPRNDPEVSQAIVEVLTRYMPRYTTVLVETRPATTFAFTMSCISAPEPLPKRAAAAFWSTFLALTAQPQPLQGLLDEVIEHFGQPLARCLVGEIAHNSMRSDIETLSDPLKKLWSRHPRARSWFETALSQEPRDTMQGEAAGQRLIAAASPQVKYKFLEQLRVAKDLGTVRKAMQEFGAGCKAAWRAQ